MGRDLKVEHDPAAGHHDGAFFLSTVPYVSRITWSASLRAVAALSSWSKHTAGLDQNSWARKGFPSPTMFIMQNYFFSCLNAA